MKEKIKKLLEHIYEVGYATAEGQELYLSAEETVNKAITQILQAFKDILPKEKKTTRKQYKAELMIETVKEENAAIAEGKIKGRNELIKEIKDKL